MKPIDPDEKLARAIRIVVLIVLGMFTTIPLGAYFGTLEPSVPPPTFQWDDKIEDEVTNFFGD